MESINEYKTVLAGYLLAINDVMFSQQVTDNKSLEHHNRVMTDICEQVHKDLNLDLDVLKNIMSSGYALRINKEVMNSLDKLYNKRKAELGRRFKDN